MLTIAQTQLIQQTIRLLIKLATARIPQILQMQQTQRMRQTHQTLTTARIHQILQTADS